MLVDTHCHLNDRRAFLDPGIEVKAAREAGVLVQVVVGIDTESSRYAVEIAEQFDGVYAVVGWHPNHAADYKPTELGAIRELLKHPKVVALGEIGLDYYREHAAPEVQRLCLLDQLDLAAELGVPVVFHCREAYPDLLSILESRSPAKYLFHCFAGTAEDAQRCTSLDAYFGVDGPVTYRSASALRSVLARLPQDRVVLETDAPWMAPHPYRGQTNHSAWLGLIATEMANIWSEDIDTTARKTSENAARFFQVPVP